MFRWRASVEYCFRPFHAQRGREARAGQVGASDLDSVDFTATFAARALLQGEARRASEGQFLGDTLRTCKRNTAVGPQPGR